METTEILVGTKKYKITKLNAIDGFKLQVKVTKLIGSTLGGIGNIDTKMFQDFQKMEVSDLIGKISGAIEKLDEDKFVNLMMQLVSKNIKVVGDAEGQEALVPLLVEKLEIIEIYELAFAVLKLNLGKFIADIQLKFKGMSEKKKIGN